MQEIYNIEKVKHLNSMVKRKNKNKNEFGFDIGLALLRPILAFFVIMTHCYKYKYAKGLWKLLIIKTEKFFFHVPVFFLMSFYFSEKTLSSSQYTKKIKRLERLCIPYFLWPIIIYYLNKLLIKLSITKKVLQMKDLRIQLIYATGKMNMFSFWYQWELIFITICFYLIIFIFRKQYTNLFLIIITIISFIYQYNEKNFSYFAKQLYHRIYIFGRIIEMFPYCVMGFLISYSKIINYFRKNRLVTIITFIYLLYFFYNYKIFNNIKGCQHQGLQFFVVSICIFISFAMFPSELIKDKTIIKTVKQITNFTAGIYFIHMNFSEYVSKYIISIKIRTINGCILIYLMCYLISFIGSLIFWKTKLLNLFE